MGLLYEYVSKEEQKQIDYEDGYTDGMEQGIERGIEQGMAKGMEQGIAKGKYEDATKMKACGIGIEMIKEITGLSLEEIEAL